MKKILLIALVMVVAISGATFAQSYASVTAGEIIQGLTVESVTILSTTVETRTEVLSSTAETRLIGGRNNIEQYRLVQRVKVSQVAITVMLLEGHRGNANSRGIQDSIIYTDTVVLSESITTTTSDWGPAHNLPSGIR